MLNTVSLNSLGSAPKVNHTFQKNTQRTVRFGTGAGEGSSRSTLVKVPADYLAQVVVAAMDDPRVFAKSQNKANDLAASLLNDQNLKRQLNSILQDQGEDAVRHYLQSDKFQTQTSQYARQALSKSISQPFITRKNLIKGVRDGACTVVIGQYGVPLVTSNPFVSTAVTTGGVGMLGRSGYKLGKSLMNPPDGSPEKVEELVKHATEGNLPGVRKMVGSYVELNKPNQRDWTPLQAAAHGGHTPVIHFLLSAGADIDKDNRKGMTPLFLATLQQHLESVLALVAMGANVNKASDKEGGHGDTPLWNVSTTGNEHIAKVLMNAGANLNKPSKKWDLTPMQAASRNGHKHIVDLLRKAGAIDVDAQREAEEKARRAELARQEMLRQKEAERQRNERVERRVETGVLGGLVGLLGAAVGVVLGVDITDMMN